MEPENIQPQQTPQMESGQASPEPVVPVTVETAETPVQNEASSKKTPVQMIMGLFDGIKGKLNKPKVSPTISTDTTSPFGQETTVQSSDVSEKKPKIPKKVILIAILVIILLVVLALIASMISRNGGGPINQTPSSSTTPSPTPLTEVPSQYADDEDVVQIKAQMEELNKNLNDGSFRDETLRVPNLDWNVSFK